jgi:hypothetical protein
MTEEDQDSPVKEPAAEPAQEPAAEPTPSEAEPAKPKDDSDSAANPAVDPGVVPKKSKKGRRKRARDGAPRPELDADGRERPAFLLSFPHDPELERLITAFELGNYALVREGAPKLLERSERPEVKAAARELLARIEPDPLVKFLLAVAIALFVAVVAFVYHSHG